jgi:hypothetical protein
VPTPRPGPTGAFPDACDEPLPSALAILLARRHLSVTSLGSLLRAEGVAISRSRLHQLATGAGAAPTPEQLERLASVLGVGPGFFAEYRLWRARALLDPNVVGFDRAMANFDRLRGRRRVPGLDAAAGEAPPDPRYPPSVTRKSKEPA